MLCACALITQYPKIFAQERGSTGKNFDRGVRVILLGLKFDELFFLGLLKMRVFLGGGLKICINVHYSWVAEKVNDRITF